jgi:hypothetical protein
MQLLIDSATETPAGLRHAALVLNYWAALTEGHDQPSINGDGGEITLTTTETHTIGDISHTIVHAAAKRPVPPQIGPAPAPGPVAPLPANNPAPPLPPVHPERHPDAPAPEAPAAPADSLDPKVVFGRFGAGSVPAGTNVDPSHAGGGTKAAPPAPGDSSASAPPAPMTTQTNALPAMTTAAGGVVRPELDKAGIPWDGRIHSDTRKQNADGTWRFRRNLETVTRDAVMAELKAAAGQQVQLPPGQSTDAVAGNVPVPPEAPPVPQQPVAANTLPATPGVPTAPVSLPALPVQPSVNVGVPDPPNTGVVPPPVTGFRELMTKINVARAHGKLSQEQVETACREAGADSVTALAAQPALVPAVDKVLNRFLGVAA